MFNQQGFAKVYNTPGAPGGETNGLYAAVTQNDVVPVDDQYLTDNNPDFLPGLGDLIDEGLNAYTQYQRAQAEAERQRREAERAAQPTMTDQFNGLTFWEKAAFVMAVAGFAFVIVRR